MGRAKKYPKLYGTEIKHLLKTQRKVTIISLTDFKAAEKAGTLNTIKLAIKVEPQKVDVNMIESEESDG